MLGSIFMKGMRLYINNLEELFVEFSVVLRYHTHIEGLVFVEGITVEHDLLNPSWSRG